MRRGITTLAVLQSLAQARHRWGREQAGAIWDAATVKVMLGGQANAEDLADMSRLLGEVEVTETSVSYSRWGERSTSVSTRTKAILEPARLRTLPFGTGVLLLRSAPPIMLELTRWTDRPDGKRLVADRARLENTVRIAAGDQRVRLTESSARPRCNRDRPLKPRPAPPGPAA